MAAPAGPMELEAKVIQVLPHDVGTFTEGLEVLDGSLYESSGIYRQSWVQEADLSSGRVSRRVALPASWFGEGLALVDGGLWHLTWREHTAVFRDGRTLGELRRVTYDGEGWGLCHDRARDRLMMSDGSATLSLRDPQSFELLGRITVHDSDGPVSGLNELECTGTDVWANVWPTEEIARIDPSTGRVTATLHIGALPDLPPAARRPGNVNGIAVDPSTHDLLITGKYWPHVYRVRTQRAER
ncbi:glutaminyl-peptide cyclotransferase [Streptomyces shenzhenensis]|uniref:glutaminyl-peptide cyclotransferase n=1 Tax=Streptomyces shenzhenensis TaxID=943815 RepID=UPI001F17B8F1|nr:glutaminyl-peptide cyclotransferase [Streptomyces shenzhenensis]